MEDVLPRAEDAEQSGSRQNGSGSRTKATSSVDAAVQMTCDELDQRRPASCNPANADLASRVCRIDEETERDMTQMALPNARVSWMWSSQLW